MLEWQLHESNGSTHRTNEKKKAQSEQAEHTAQRCGGAQVEVPRARFCPLKNNAKIEIYQLVYQRLVNYTNVGTVIIGPTIVGKIEVPEQF